MQILHSYIYGVRVPDGPLVPRLAIRSLQGFFFMDPSELGASTSYDGPHLLSADSIRRVIEEGDQIDESYVECLWSDRLREWAENSSPSDYLKDVDTWLRLNEHWPGSSISLKADPSGLTSEATVSVRATNRYQLMTLLRWLDMPRDLVARATGVERL
jgi:hypothetical protein